MVEQLPHIPSWSHAFAREVLRPGDLAVDLTAGRGRDTLALWGAVAPAGCVLAFDLQEEALAASAALLAAARVPCRRHAQLPAGPLSPGVHLVAVCHSRLCEALPAAPRVILANLGFLPGSSSALATAAPTTLAAVRQSLAALAPGGRLVLVIYVGHEQGREEATLLDELFAALDARRWFTLRLTIPNRHEAPYLLVAERRRSAAAGGAVGRAALRG